VSVAGRYTEGEPALMNRILATTLLGCALAAWLGACGHKTAAPQPASGTAAAAETPIEIDRRLFPATSKALDAADSALDNKDHEVALENARRGREELARERAEVGDAERTASLERVTARAILLEGLALRRLGRSLDALLSLRDERFPLDACKGGVEPRCEEHGSFLMLNFPTIAKRSDGIALAPLVALRRRLDTVVMSYVDRAVRREKRPVALLIEPSSAKVSGENVILRIDGKGKGKPEECGELAALDLEKNFDVNKCVKQATNAPRASFTVKVLASDLAKPIDTKGDRVFVVVDPGSWKRSGSSFDAGIGRVSFVVPASE
jgi:hypothetical protein